MGSGDKFRIGRMPSNILALGMSIGRRCEHEWSIHIDLIVIQIYIGFGKGYEDFE
jgi:hypothetical protein